VNAPITLHALRPATDHLAEDAIHPQPGHAAGRRLAFLHIPKTAGTAFGVALAQRFAEREIASTFRMALTSGAADPLVAHVAQGYRLLGVGSHLDQDKLDAILAGLPAGERLFTVTVLRDPRARLISQYRHWQRTNDEALAPLPAENREAFLAARRLPLGEFLAARIPFVETHFRNLQARMLCGLCTSELMDEASLLDTARANLAAIDVVGTTEALDQALARIAEAYGWTTPDAVQPINVAPRLATPLDAATEALIAEYNRVDQALWEAAQAWSPPASAPPRPPRRYFRPPPALLDTILDGGTLRFSMADALDGEGWHVREGGAAPARWTGPGRRATIRLRAPLLRQVALQLHLVSVLDWAMVEQVGLTLDSVAPLAPPRVEHVGSQPVLRADFVLPDAGSGRRALTIDVPFTRSHAEVDPGIDDHRQKGLAIGDISLSASATGPATLGALFWPGEPWSALPPAALVDQVTPLRHQEPPPAERNLTFDLPLLKGILDVVAPDHVWAAARRSILQPLERGTPLAWPAAAGRLAIIATLFEIAARGAAIATLAARHQHAVLLLPCAEDFRLRGLVAHPMLAPHLHLVGCTNAILVANLAGIRRAGGAALVEAFLLLLERIAGTTPEQLGALSDDFGAGYALRQLGATLTGLEALNAGAAGPRALLATLLLDPAEAATPEPLALLARGRALAALPGTPLALVDPLLLTRLGQLLDQLVAVAPGSAEAWRAALAAQECAFRIASLLAGWQRFGLAANATAGLAQRLRAGKAAPPLYPKPLKPFGEYIDFYKAEARIMAAQPHPASLVTPLDRLGGGLDHVVRLNQAAREIEVALRLLGDRFPGEEILWVDAGCSYGVVMNGVVPPGNIRGRCSFLGFDFNAPAIEAARIVAGNAGNTHCRFAVGDVAEARSLAAGRRIHLITAFEVLEHCPDPLGVLRDYRAMDPGMLVVGSPLAEPQSVFPAEQHLWAFNAKGFAALAEAAGFALVGINHRLVGKFVGGHDWVTVTATTGEPRTMGMV
jgi:hypothetical protein